MRSVFTLDTEQEWFVRRGLSLSNYCAILCAICQFNKFFEGALKVSESSPGILALGWEQRMDGNNGNPNIQPGQEQAQSFPCSSILTGSCFSELECTLW